MHNVYSVGQLNAYIKNMFTQDYLLQSVFVKGEVSNCKYHTSGHIYFTLKDPKGAISCVMFAGNRRGLSFRMQDGQQVVVGGSVDVYEKSGQYQVYAKQIVLDGAGALYERYEQLKKELEASGMFAKEYKKPIPRYVKTLGVVTARTGAAVRDIIQIAKRRNPFVRIILYPAIVQGEAATQSIISGIRTLEQVGVDVMIVGRGGGSIEDLWAFNEREVAEAVFACSVPIISAVGHETDTTIIDYVSDLRAPTPSAAAELAIWDIREILQTFAGYENALQTNMDRVISRKRDMLLRMERQIGLLSPSAKIRGYRQYQAQLRDRLDANLNRVLAGKRHALELYVERMKGLSPLEKLSSGYSYVENEEGKNVRSVAQVKEGDVLTINFQDGSAQAKVIKTSEKERKI
ncbi:MAG: exodeoxyribonuclease VII large subunit [Lachnospiraceae bacterium]|nr:exodeoxyribonuclease VII large subunit [Lachnospiraceae bacterium]